MGLLMAGAIGGVAGSGNADNFLRSDIVGDIAGVLQFVDPIFSPAILSAQEGYNQEQAMKKEARAVESQARLDAAQARQRSLFQYGQEYLYFARAGVFSGVGSPLDMLTQNSLEREKEALAIELKGWNEGKRLRITGANTRRAAVIGAVKAMTDPLKQALAQFGMGQSSLANAGTGASAAGGVSYAGATAAGIDAAAGGAAAVNGAGTGLGALALA